MVFFFGKDSYFHDLIILFTHKNFGLMDFFGSSQGEFRCKNDPFNTSDGLFWVISAIFGFSR